LKLAMKKPPRIVAVVYPPDMANASPYRKSGSARIIHRGI